MKIAIVGCGPAGLSCALQLARQDHQLTLFERMDNLAMQGSGVLIQPVGLAALDLLGIRHEVEQYGQKIHGITGRSGQANHLCVDVDYTRLPNINYALGLQRGALFNLLYEKILALGLKIFTGVAITAIDYQKDNSVRILDDKNNSYGPFNLVIDASGAHSKLRHYALFTPASKPLQYGSLWGKVNAAPESDVNRGKMQLFSDNQNVGIGLMPIGRLTLTGPAQTALFWNMKWSNYPQWRNSEIETWINQSIKQWPITAPFLKQITRHDQLYLAKFIYHTLKKPYGNKIVFVGDAAHVTNPQLGQGVNMSLVDAVVLGWSLAHQRDLDSALTLYGQLRRNHVRFYQTLARILTPFYQSDNSIAIRCRDWLYPSLCKISKARTATARIVGGTIGDPFKFLH
jgi:salicylate hydroxylase